MLGRCALGTGLLVLWAAAIGAAERLNHRAENNVPVAIVEVIRTPAHTEIHLETQAPRGKVCWSSKGPNSPYLLAGGRRYRLIGGDKITDCPTQRDYAAHEEMVLRFEPLPSDTREFSLVEGEGGENQMIDPKSYPNRQFWNFLHVQAN